MSHIALYRKWRPLVFEDVVGQTYVSETLRNSVKTGRISHAYLFCGTRGTGKTSSAKIFSRAINCENPQNGDPCNKCKTCQGILNGTILDVYEMDAASNNGVDNIREINDEVAYGAARAKYKVYIIDEVHMLSTGAFNALLKTLEEPPENVVFILATTEARKIPETISSRCQRFDFGKIPVAVISSRLKTVTDAENIEIEPEATNLIAELARGSMRDALSLLERCAGLGEKVTYDYVLSVSGSIDRRATFKIGEAIADSDVSAALRFVHELVANGKSVSNLFEELLTHFRNVLVAALSPNAAEIIDKSPEAAAEYARQAAKFSPTKVTDCINIFGEYFSYVRLMKNSEIALDVAIVKACSNFAAGQVLAQSATDNEIIAVQVPKKVSEIEPKISNLPREKRAAEAMVRAKTDFSNDAAVGNAQNVATQARTAPELSATIENIDDTAVEQEKTASLSSAENLQKLCGTADNSPQSGEAAGYSLKLGEIVDASVKLSKVDKISPKSDEAVDASANVAATSGKSNAVQPQITSEPGASAIPGEMRNTSPTSAEIARAASLGSSHVSDAVEVSPKSSKSANISSEADEIAADLSRTNEIAGVSHKSSEIKEKSPKADEILLKVNQIRENLNQSQNAKPGSLTRAAESVAFDDLPPIDEPPPEFYDDALASDSADMSDGKLWNIALDVIKSESKQLFTFLYSAEMRLNSNKIVIRLKSPLGFDKINKPSGIKYLTDLFKKISGRGFDVSVELEGASSEVASDPIDEIIAMKDKFGDIMTIE